LSAPRPCPLCGRPLYAWVALPPRPGQASVGLPLETRPAEERVIVRCEECGTALERDAAIDLAAEWRALERSSAGDEAIAAPNRASLQAWIGVEGWAGFDRAPGRLLLTPAGLELLAERNGEPIDRPRTPASWRAHGWMWQTLLNGLTFHPNFAREVRAGRLRPSSARGRARFAIDVVVTVLGAPLIALVSAPLELAATLVRRGGVMVARRRDRRG
jgi:hypothetical protein